MGTRGLLGSVQMGVYKGTFNPDNSDPPMLDNAISRFILSHTDKELKSDNCEDRTGECSSDSFLEAVLTILVDLDL